METVLVIDARSRAMNVFTASVTRMGADVNKIILRKGVDVGKLKNFSLPSLPLPTVVLGSYRASTSCGHVTPLGADHHDAVMVVGGSGFGFTDDAGVRKGDALRPFRTPISGTVLPKGTMFLKNETHKNSNRATAEATLAGLKLRAELEPSAFILAEGQSDYTSGYEFAVQEDGELGIPPQEHRDDIFSLEKMFDRFVEKTCWSDGQQALNVAMLHATLASGVDGKDVWGVVYPPPIFGDLLTEVVTKKLKRLRDEGWTFGFTESHVAAMSPNGNITTGNARIPYTAKVLDVFNPTGVVFELPETTYISVDEPL